MIQPGDLFLLAAPKGKSYLFVLDPDKKVHSNYGCIPMSEIAEANYGDELKTHKGKSFRLIRPTIHDLVRNVKRQTQVIYPKDMGYIIMRLGIGPGSVVVESGCGSGALTTALAWYVGDSGRVHCREKREEFATLCRSNLEAVGLADRVDIQVGDAAEGFGFAEDFRADAVFLDMRAPWECLASAAEVLAPGAPIGFLLPTVNQIETLLRALRLAPFSDVEIVELLMRRYKPVADRLRPEDRMIAHTGFLVFARRATAPPKDEPDAGHRGRCGGRRGGRAEYEEDEACATDLDESAGPGPDGDE